MTKQLKQVKFNLNKNETYLTYSYKEYDRYPIDSILFRKCYNRISHEEWMKEQQDLLKYKLTEMIVHKDSIFF